MQNSFTPDNLNDLPEEELRKAVALFYDGDNAPVVTAKGIGAEAQKIIDIAHEHEVPLTDNSQLVDLLVTLELGDEIPEALYVAIAYIIAFAYELQGKTPEGFAWPEDNV